jgi:hypothetical protein
MIEYKHWMLPIMINTEGRPGHRYGDKVRIIRRGDRVGVKRAEVVRRAERL